MPKTKKLHCSKRLKHWRSITICSVICQLESSGLRCKVGWSAYPQNNSCMNFVHKWTIINEWGVPRKNILTTKVHKYIHVSMCYNKRLWNTQNAFDAPDARIPISSSGKTNLRQAQGSWQPSAKESPSNIWMKDSNYPPVLSFLVIFCTSLTEIMPRDQSDLARVEFLWEFLYSGSKERLPRFLLPKQRQ
jgi:hypothetical protein